MAITLNLYKKATNELSRKDSVEAMVDFQDCLNFKSCNDSAYYYLAFLHKSINRSVENYMENIDLFLDKGHENNRLTWQLAQYTADKNYRKAEIHLKKLLQDPDYRPMAAELLMKFFRKNFMFDSLLKYEEELVPHYTSLYEQSLHR